MDNALGINGAFSRRNRGGTVAAMNPHPSLLEPTSEDDKQKPSSLSLSWSDWNNRKNRPNVVLLALACLALASYHFYGQPQFVVVVKPTETMNYNSVSLAPTIAPALPLKVPYPIFLASFSKSGTTSTYRAFQCHLGRDYVAHRYTKSAANGGKTELIGRCVEQNIKNHRLPLAGCGTNANNHTETVVWTDTSYIGGEHGCYHPNLDALDAIWDAYPHATLLYVRRNATEWFHSANSKRASFIPKWADSCPQMPRGRNVSVWVNFYNNYTQRLRNFAKQRRGQMTYVEVELENPNTGRILEEQIGLSASCWKHCKSSFVNEACKELQQGNISKTNNNH